ncbi:Putative zinc metalloprotease Rip3 [bacterium HR28]|uniref:Zinc metalloprotease n=1 Tax=Thermomicrobium roseum TaxID=500 RepID=A0A7C1X3Q1_THERO|nr:Putative zinc metalloprotease Rip3 [bacterium HR28]
MEASIRLGRIRGIEIGVHYSWLLVFALLTYSLAVGVFPSWYPGWEPGTYWAIGALSSLLLFASVLAHELGHSLVAQSRGVPVVSIVLFIFGGVAQLADEARRARDEFLIAVAGPAVSVVIGVISIVLWPFVDDINQPLGAVLEYLGWANLILVAFNSIPAYPLDGGRVLRALLWGAMRNVLRATRIAAGIGVAIGFLFMAGGLFLVFRSPLSGIWLIAIGWFLQNAAQQSYQQLMIRRFFEGVRVGQLMEPEPPTISPDLTVDELVDALLVHNVRCFPVVENGRLVGIVTLTDVRHVPRHEWSSHHVRDLMTPRERLITASPDDDLERVLRLMAGHEIHQIPVVDDSRLLGLLTRNALLRFLQLRQELARTPDEVAAIYAQQRRERRVS